MIIRSSLVNNPWQRVIPPFFIFNMFSLSLFWLVFDILHYEKMFLNIAFVLIIVFSVLLFLFGYFFDGPERLKFFVLVMGIFGTTPIYVSTMIPFVLCLVFPWGNQILKTGIFVLYLFVAFVWCFFEIKSVHKIFEKTKYFENQINFCGKKSYVSRDKIKDIYDFDKNNFSEKKYWKIFGFVFPMATLTYPLQKYLTIVGGDAATFSFCSVLSVPLSIYMLGKVSIGYYLWIHQIGQYEKQKNTKVILK